MATASEKMIKLLLTLIRQPYRYTKRELASVVGYKKTDSLDKPFEYIKAADLDLVFDKSYRYAILPSNDHRELKHLLPFTSTDWVNLKGALKYVNDRDRPYLLQRLETLYDFQRLGLAALRQPNLDRINTLEAAKKQHKQVILKQYRSNSNEIRDRYVEVYHLDIPHDTVQAFDVEAKQRKHFKLTRMEHGVQMTDQAWQYTAEHLVQPTDVFRIVGPQTMVRLQLDVYAYNSLVDTYPRAKGSCLITSDQRHFDFQTDVNEQFLGIVNFILGNAGHVKIMYPEALKIKVLERIKNLDQQL